GCVLLLIALPVISAALPEALLAGFKHAPLAALPALPFLLPPLIVWWLAWRNKPNLAMVAAGMAILFGVAYFKSATFPALDRDVSVRGFWRTHQAAVETSCIDPAVRREWIYGLNYYAGRPLPMCHGQPAGPAVTLREGRLTVADLPR